MASNTTSTTTVAEDAAAAMAAVKSMNISEPAGDKPANWWTQWKGPDVELTVDEKTQLAASVAQEITKDEAELKALFTRKAHPVCYDGFEPSGRMHIAQGLLRAMNVNRLTQSGVKFVFWVADYFALMNQKMGGDIEKIRNCGQYMIEIWKACGMDLTNVEFVWASDWINNHAEKYWFNVLQIALRNTISRVKRCGQIMGREASDELACAQIFYPCMQCNDVFMLKCDMTQLGLDQRKVNMLAREYCEPKNNIMGVLDHLVDSSGRMHKPVVLSHHMLAALTGLNKMSKSDPMSAIFMEDEAEAVDMKIKAAYCPPGKLFEMVDLGPGVDPLKKINGCLEYCKYIVLPMMKTMDIPLKAGTTTTYNDYAALEADYIAGKVYPSELKPALAKAINTLLEPVRKHFTTDTVAKDLLVKMKQYMEERAAKKAGGKKGNQKKSKKKVKGGKGGKAKGPAPCFDMTNDAVISCLDIRVGSMSNATPITDKLYKEDIKISDTESRVICSGLVGKVPVADMTGLCLVVVNLKPAKMGPDKIPSAGMVLAAVAADGSIELLRPPAGSTLGERVKVSGIDYSAHGVATPNQLNRSAGKKAFRAITSSPDFKTSSAAEATWRDRVLITSKGEVTVKSLKGALIH